MSLRKWVKERWVDIGAPKKMVSTNLVVEKKEMVELILNVFQYPKPEV